MIISFIGLSCFDLSANILELVVLVNSTMVGGPEGGNSSWNLKSPPCWVFKLLHKRSLSVMNLCFSNKYNSFFRICKSKLTTSFKNSRWKGGDCNCNKLLSYIEITSLSQWTLKLDYARIFQNYRQNPFNNESQTPMYT